MSRSDDLLEKGPVRVHNQEEAVSTPTSSDPSTAEEQRAAIVSAVHIDEATAERHLVTRCDLHVVPVLFVVYLLSFLDRINIGNAKIQGLTTELALSGTQYNVALLIFFVPYILLEVPSNLMMRRLRPSTWLSLLLFLWGVAAMCQGLVKNYAGLVACRFFLGVFEAGVFPGCAYLISMYYKRHEMQKRWAVFFSSGLVAGAFGGLLAFALVKMDKLGRYSGWRWIFIIEGLATIAFSFVAKFTIADWPETATFLSTEEKDLLARRLKADGASDIARMDRLDRPAIILIVSDWKIWVGSLIYMGAATSGYSTSFFIPTILNSFGYSPSQAQLHTIPIYAFCTFTTLLTAYLSDRLQHRYLFCMAGILIATIGYILLLLQTHLPLSVRYLAIFLVTSGVYVVQPLCVTWLANNLSGHYKRAVGVAMQIAVGNVGGVVGSNIYLAQEAPLYRTGYGTALGMLWMCGVMCTLFYVGLRMENNKRDRGGRDERLELPEVQLGNLGDAHPTFRFIG